MSSSADDAPQEAQDDRSEPGPDSALRRAGEGRSTLLGLQAEKVPELPDVPPGLEAEDEPEGPSEENADSSEGDQSSEAALSSEGAQSSETALSPELADVPDTAEIPEAADPFASDFSSSDFDEGDVGDTEFIDSDLLDKKLRESGTENPIASVSGFSDDFPDEEEGGGATEFMNSALLDKKLRESGTDNPALAEALLAARSAPPPPQSDPEPTDSGWGAEEVGNEFETLSAKGPSSTRSSPNNSSAVFPVRTPNVVDLEGPKLEHVRPMDLPAMDRYGDYDLLGRLAYGGMAEIFLARQEAKQGAQRLLVVKRVLPHIAPDPHFIEMFIDEAKLAIQLNHANICHVYTFGEDQGSYFIAMEWVNGMPLSKVIRKARQLGGLPLPVALKIISQVAEALDYAHRATDSAGQPLAIVHRDVSPQNIMISFDGAVKLLDFGIAKANSHSARTDAGVIKGKYAYMSPQQCVGERVDGRADIFALGICLFEALAGRNPFRRKTEFETMTKIVGDPTPPVDEWRVGVPSGVAAILERALRKKPELRFQTAGEMQVALEEELPKLHVIVNGAMVGDYVRDLFAEEVDKGPELDLRPSLVPEKREVSSIPSGPIEPQVGGHLRPSEHPPAPASEPGAPTSPRPLGRSSRIPEETSRISQAPLNDDTNDSAAPWLKSLVAVLLLGLLGLGAAGLWMNFRPEQRVVLDASTLPRAGLPEEPANTPLSNEHTPVPAPLPREDMQPELLLGSTLIESVPPGALVRLDGRVIEGVTPLEVGMLQAGPHMLRVTLAGHEVWEEQIEITADVQLQVQPTLAPVAAAPRRTQAARPRGQLSLNTRPWSQVYLRGRLLGTTPIGELEVPSGNLRLRFVDRDGNEHRRRVRVPPGGHVRESFDLTN